MVGGISNSLSALNAFQTKFDVAARNVSNSNTDGYKADRVAMVANGQNGGVTAKVEKDEAESPMALETGEGGEKMVQKSNVDLAGSMVDMMTAERGFQANVSAVKTADEMMGTILDLKG